MKRKMSILVMLMLVFALVLSACGQSATPAKTEAEKKADAKATTAKAADAKATDAKATDAKATEAKKAAGGATIKIGGLAPLTGGVSVYGIAVNNGVKLAVDTVNKKGGILGKQIEYIVYDEKGDAVEATNAYNRLVNDDKIVGLIGDVTSGPSIAVGQRAARDNMPMITASGTSADITKQGKNVFRACFIDENQGFIMGNFAADNLKAKKAAILYNVSDNYSKGLADSFTAQAKVKGLQVVSTETYNNGDKDFKAQLTRIMAAGADSLYIPNYYNDNIMIVRQAKQVGLKVPFLGGDGWDGVLEKNVIGESKNDADGSYFTNHYSPDDPTPVLQDFLKLYRDTYKTEAVSFSCLGYDAAMILFNAIEKAGSTDGKAIVAAMAKTEYSGVTGNIKFDANNNPIKTVSIVEIKNGAYTLNTKLELGK